MPVEDLILKRKKEMLRNAVQLGTWSLSIDMFKEQNPDATDNEFQYTKHSEQLWNDLYITIMQTVGKFPNSDVAWCLAVKPNTLPTIEDQTRAVELMCYAQQLQQAIAIEA